MSKILKYEFKKLFSNKSVVLSIIILVIISIIGFYSNQYQYNDYLINNIDRYNELQEKYKDDIQGIESFEQELSDHISIYYRYIVEDNNLVYEEDKALLDKFNNSIYADDLNKLNVDLYLTELLSNQIKYVNSYKNYLESVEENKKTLIKASIFYEKGSFSYNNIIKTAEDFEKLDVVKTTVGIEKGIESISTYSLSDMIIILVIIILSISIFSSERENETLILLKANKKGRAPLIITKLITLSLVTVVVVATIYGAIIAIANNLYGFGDIDRSIQSISIFRESNLIITVKEYLMIFIILKIITSIIIIAIFSLIIQCTKNINKSYIAIVGFIFSSFMAYTFIAFNSSLNLFKYLNIFSFLEVGQLIGQYININMFTKPVNILFIYIVFAISIVPIIVAINIILFVKEREIKGRRINIKVVSKIKERISKVTIPSTLFLNEGYKLIIENKVYLIMGIVFIISISSLNIDKEKIYENDAIIYKNYIDKLEGPLDLEKEKYIQDEMEMFINIDEEYIKISNEFENGEITEIEYDSKKLELDIKSRKRKAFNEVYNQYNHLKMIESDKGINGSFIDKDIQEGSFNLKDELTKGIYVSVLMIIILSNVFAKEYKSGAIKLIQGSKERDKLFVYKYLISTLIILVMFILVYLPNYINVINEFGTEFLKAPIQSLQQYVNVGVSLNILEFIILENIFKLIGAISIVIIILSLSNIFKNHITTIIVSTILLIPSIIMKLIGIGVFEKVTLSNVFSLNYSLGLDRGISFNFIYFSALLILSLGFLYMTFKSFKNQKLINREVRL